MAVELISVSVYSGAVEGANVIYIYNDLQKK